jgi:cobalt-zinc-cadmium efflux system outer membrane protein
MMLFLISGCAHQLERTAWPQPRSLAEGIEAYKPSHKPGTSADQPAPGESLGTIELQQALALALMHNPELAGYAYEVRSAEARALQAGLRPNPELEIEIEEISDSGLDDAIASFLLSQSIELGGKRKKRAQVAHLEASAAGWEYEMARLDVFTGTKKAFAEVIAAQEKVILAQEMVDLSDKMLKSVSERVEAGRDSPIEEARAITSLAAAEIEQRKAASELVTVRNSLAAQWGGSAQAFDDARGKLDILKPAPPFDELSERLSQNPDIASWDTVIEQSHNALALERAMRIPDLAIGAGLEYSNMEREATYRLGLAIPIPFFDRNQGGHLEAQTNLLKAQKERDAALVGALAELREIYQELTSSYDEVVALRDDVLPAAEKALEGSRDGFRRGKYSYLEVIDAQRTMFELKSQYLEALVTYHSARADLERLIGDSL